MKRVFRIFNRYYILILLLIVLISFGQVLFMQPWQDDNALFFKLAHIEEPVGFLGKGLFGEGPYRYTATPYYFIYKLFGFNINAFFGLALTFYFGACLSIYYLFKRLIDKAAGMVAGILMAVNYVTSDSFIRLFNSISTSLGIIFFSLLFISYSNFFKRGKITWYFLAVLYFFLLLEVSFTRSHFVILIVLISDLLISFNLKNRQLPPIIKYLSGYLMRSLPFLVIFYWVYIVGGDPRSRVAIDNIRVTLSGKVENFISLFTALGYLISPDKLTALLPNMVFVMSNPYYKVLVINLLLLIIFNLIIFFYFRSKKITLLFSLLSLDWFFVSRVLYKKITTEQPFSLLLIEFIGGIVILGILAITIRLRSDLRRKFLFLSSILIINILSYILYDPTVFYSTYNNRYLTYSYLGLIGSLAFLTSLALKNQKLIYLAIIFGWGFVNLFFNVENQRNILTQRSYPIKRFYEQLHENYPILPKGAVLYLDIKDTPKIKTRFSDAMNSSQMPQTTAIAWRYNLDRYDIYIIEDFDKLVELIKSDAVPLDKIYSFWYSDEGLHDTTKDLKKLLTQNLTLNISVSKIPQDSKTFFATLNSKSLMHQPDLDFSFDPPLNSLVSNKLVLTVKANPLETSTLKYPLVDSLKSMETTIGQDINLRRIAITYKKYKDFFRNSVNITTSSQWKANLSSNLIDDNWNTLWQADRVLWGKEKATIQFDLKKTEEIEKVVWVNGYADQTPTNYTTLVSLDGKDWRKVSKITLNQRLDPDEPQIIEFSKTPARFVKLEINETLNHDAPALSEIWVVPGEFSKLDIKKTEDFLKQPFRYIPDQLSFIETFEGLNKTGDVQIYWKSDKKDAWQTGSSAKINLIYNNQVADYGVILPAGGTKITNIKLSNFVIPGQIKVLDIKVMYPKII